MSAPPSGGTQVATSAPAPIPATSPDRAAPDGPAEGASSSMTPPAPAQAGGSQVGAAASPPPKSAGGPSVALPRAPLLYGAQPPQRQQQKPAAASPLVGNGHPPSPPRPAPSASSQPVTSNSNGATSDAAARPSHSQPQTVSASKLPAAPLPGPRAPAQAKIPNLNAPPASPQPDKPTQQQQQQQHPPPHAARNGSTGGVASAVSSSDTRPMQAQQQHQHQQQQQQRLPQPPPTTTAARNTNGTGNAQPQKSMVVTLKPSSGSAAPAGSDRSVATVPTNNANPVPTVPTSKSLALTYESVMAKKEGPRKGAFQPVLRVDVTQKASQEVRAIIRDHVEDKGLPLVLSGFHRLPAWKSSLFLPDRYLEFVGRDETCQARNLLTWQDKEMTFGELVEYSRAARPNIQSDDKHRFYGKDLACPREWAKAFQKIVPESVVYHGPEDLAATLRENERPETLMCYFGPDDTWTPLHRDLCSSLGQNLMTWTDPDASSIWFMTSTKDTGKADTYIESLGQEPYLEGFCASIKQLEQAPFPVYVCEQKLGDLVLLPPRSTHQVINRGGRTLKAAWSRLTLETLRMAIIEDLPYYQRYCRKESYRIKAVIAASVRKAADQISAKSPHSVTVDEAESLQALLPLYDQVLADEFSPDWRNHKVIGLGDNYVECDFCGGDVLQSFFECTNGSTLCAMCYCQGRTCSCDDHLALEPCQLLPFDVRLAERNHAAEVLNSCINGVGRVTILTEEELAKSPFPHSYIAACKLRKIRESPDEGVASCRICKGAYNKTGRYRCKPCHLSYCFGCLLFRYFIHPVHALAQENPEYFHVYHRGGSKKDYEEWKADPDGFHDEALAHFACIEAALTRRRCRPVDPSCKIGFMDQNEAFPRGLSGLFPPPFVGGEGKRDSTPRKRASDTVASPAQTAVAKRLRPSTLGADITPTRSSSSVSDQPATPQTPGNGAQPRITVKKLATPSPAATNANPASNGSSAVTVAAAPPSSGSLTNMACSLTELFAIFDQENKKRDKLAAERHEEMLRLASEREKREEARHTEVMHRLGEIRDAVGELLGDIARAAAAQQEQDEGRMPSGNFATTSNVRRA